MRAFKKSFSIILMLPMLLSSCSIPSLSSKGTLVVKDSKELKKTAITSHLESKIEDGKNLIYCSTFQLAWNELLDNIIKDKLTLEGSPLITPILNKKLTDKNDLSEDSYLAMSGFGKDNIVDKINKELKNKFGKEAPTLKDEIAGDDILAYAFLYKNLQFEKEFENIKDPLLFGEEKVKAFGIFKNSDKKKDIAKQIEVVDYKSYDDFIIKLKSKSEDEIILAQIKGDKDLLNTISKIDARIKTSSPTELMEGEMLIIPKFDFDITHSYQELIDKRILNKGFEDYKITKALQNTKFKLNEKGAVLKSEAKIIAQKSAQVVNRSLIFHKPFLLMLREKGSDMPYFVMWIDNTELMIK